MIITGTITLVVSVLFWYAVCKHRNNSMLILFSAKVLLPGLAYHGLVPYP